MKKTMALLIYAGLFWQNPPSAKEEFTRLLQEEHTARVSGDMPGRLQAVLKIRQLLNGAPDIVEVSAQVYLKAGDTSQALEALSQFAAMGQADDNVLGGKDSGFLPLASLPPYHSIYDRILKQMAQNKTAIGRGETAFLLADPGILAEDIDYDPFTKSFLVTSVLEKKIVRVSIDGKATDFAASPSHWPMMAVKIDAPHHLLWATEVALDGWNGVPKTDWGRSAVLCYDLRTGSLRRRIEGARGVSPGDMVLTRRGEPIVSDGDGGGVYRVTGDSLERIDRGDFISPQTAVMMPDSNKVLIPDYARGIGMLDLSTRQVVWLNQDRYALNGIDGLYYDHGSLLLTQNGTSPERVIRLGLDQTLTHIVSEQVIERATPTLGDPTHGVVVGGFFYYIANSGWDQLDEHGGVKAGGKMTAARLMRFPLRLSTQDSMINPSLLSWGWRASWITCPGAGQREYGVYHFRKSFSLDGKPDRFIIHVSADNRYRLLVNGRPVCSGPARGDLGHWNFETVDIAAYLQAGQNTLAALVWNMGVYAPVAQLSNQTAFVLQGDGDAEQLVNSDKSWKVMRDSAYSPCSTDNGARLHTYMVTGPGDAVQGAFYPWGWEQPGYDDQRWAAAEYVAGAVPWGVGTDNLWTLVPRSIPLMEERLQRIPQVRRWEELPGGDEGDAAGLGIRIADWISGGASFRVGPHKSLRLLLDQTYNTVAYPELTVSGGKGATIKLIYAESLFKGAEKGNRNVIDGKEIKGNYDVFVADGGQRRVFRPLWVRTFRYMQVEINTGDDSLLIDDLHGMYTGYPFERKADFASSDTSLQPIWDVGWRTARLCAGETYFDCPYYEQLQYEADTRIQCLISLYATGDDRLMRKALLDFYHSRVPEGLTQGRYPSDRFQLIPPFSLWWVVMIHDYWMLRKDDAFIRQFLPAVRGVLDWYEGHVDTAMGMLGPMPWWGFVDWADAFGNGVPAGAVDGHSSVITLQYVYTLKQAAELFDYFGKKGEAQYVYTAQRERKLATALGVGTYRACYDHRKGEMANTPEKSTFSQHAGILAVLAGVIPAADRKGVMRRVLADSTLQQATFYFRFYLTQAMKAAGMGDLYYSQLGPWRKMLSIGLTTFAEKPEPTRSDCHAWSASPEYDFLATICGIGPDAPGFSRVLIRPALGELSSVEGSMPHPEGMIRVKLKKAGMGIRGTVELPAGVSGRFVYGGKELILKGGVQTVEL